MNIFQSVDVVIPTYNGACFLGDAIESVLRQTVQPREIIVIDDGSTDDTDTVLGKFEGSIKVIKHPVNRGLPAARNTGIHAGTAPLIAFLDGDDVWKKNKLEIQLPVFSKENFPGLCYSSLCDCDSHLKPLGPPRRFKPRDCENVFTELFLHPFPMPPSTVIVKRDAILQAGCFDETVLKNQDYECWLRIAMLYMVSCVTENLCLRRIHEQAISSTYALGEKLAWEFKVIERCAEAAKRFHVELPMTAEERKIFAIRRRLHRSLMWNDKIGADFYRKKLEKLGLYSSKEKLYCSLLAARTSILELLKPVTIIVKKYLKNYSRN